MPTIFISHRSEYARQACSLREAIVKSSGGKCRAFVSSDLTPGTVWLNHLKEKLQEAQVLVLLYGAPHEDWTWCFYEVGYFSALMDIDELGRKILCTTRKKINPPGPLHNIQMVHTEEQLSDSLKIFLKQHSEVDGDVLSNMLSKAQIFGDVSEYSGYRRLQLTFAASEPSIPDDAQVSGDKAVLHEHFDCLSETLSWGDIRRTQRVLDNDQMFYDKWLGETENCITQARKGKFSPSQALLFSTMGLRPIRWLIVAARNQADGQFYCDFLVVEEIGGLFQSLPRHKLVLLTAIRIAFRFRYELVDRFKSLPEDFTREEWNEITRAIRSTLTNLLTEADARGINAVDELLDMVRAESDRDAMAETLAYWPVVQDLLYPAIGLKPSQDRRGFSHDEASSITQPQAIETLKRGLAGLDDINRLFLHFCCKTLAQVQSLAETDVEKHIQNLRRTFQSHS